MIKPIIWLSSITSSTVFEIQKAIVTISEPKKEKNHKITYYPRLLALMLLACGTAISRHVCKRRFEQFEATRPHTAARVSRRGRRGVTGEEGEDV
uniref:Uncharacterized protein n=1 Tax=Physcomitrium patens TaxID=3218 RepID=A0A2K1K7T1_PHYPA|nr:hypothetical protein PHYPA_011722 [Physcomitrium patens]